MTSLMIVELLVVLLPSSSSLCSSTLRVLWLWQCCLWLIHWVLMLGKKIKCRVFIISEKSEGCLWANHGFYAFPLLFLQHIELGSLTLSLITNRICQYNTVGILHLVKGMLTT